MGRRLASLLPSSRPALSALLLLASALATDASAATRQDPAKSAPTAPPADAAPATPAAPARDDGARGLLGVAEAESARTARALRERILVLLRNFTSARTTAADRGKGILDNVVTLGADAVPQLMDVLREVDKGSLDAAFASAASRALCGIFERTKSKTLLSELSGWMQTCGTAAKAETLDGLAELDHPQVIEIVAPLLISKEPALLSRAVRVLGRQASSAEFAVQQLRPLLSQPSAPQADVVQALHALKDHGALEAVQGLTAKGDDPALLLACVRYLAELGGRTAVPPLRSLLLRSEGNLPETLLKQAIDAAQAIGLRETDAKPGAEELLLEVYKKLRDSKLAVSEHARWQLGPFKTEEALKSYEDELEQAIAGNKRMKQSNLGRYLELAKARLRFEAWRKADDSLDKARDEDPRKNRSDEINELVTVALCGQGKYTGAEKLLQEIRPERRLELLQTYPVLQKMAREPRYKDLFPQGK